MSEARLTTVLTVATFVIVAFGAFLLTQKQPLETHSKVVTMPQSISYDLAGGPIITPRNPGESTDDWLDRHQAAIDASRSRSWGGR